MIEEIRQATGYGIRQICAALEVPRSSFYHAASPTPTQSEERRIGDFIEAIFKRHRRRYGYRRIGEELSGQGVVCAPDRIRRLMHARGLRALQPKTYVPKTSDGRADKPSPELLLDQALPTKPDQVWAGDITFIPPLRGLALSRCGHRSLLTQDRRLVPGRSPARGVGRRCPPPSLGSAPQPS